MTAAEQKAAEYTDKLFSEVGFNCFSCYDCDNAKEHGGFRSGIPDDEFSKQVETAFIAGYEQGETDNSSKEAFDSRGRFIDWCLIKYPDVVRQYLGFEE